MNTDSAGLLQLLWMASPTLPVGGFSYSEGLEAAVQANWVHNELSAAHWLVDQLHLSQARSELAVQAQAYPAWQHQNWTRVNDLNNWVLHTRESHELRQQTVQMGRSLQVWTQQFGAQEHAIAHATHQALKAANLQQPSYPVVQACLAAHSGVSLSATLHTHAFAWAENAVQAAIKSVPLGQSAGQRILARLVSHIPQAVETALNTPEPHRQSFTPGLAILSARHETQYSRLFRS
jgi:urease accessory protein